MRVPGWRAARKAAVVALGAAGALGTATAPATVTAVKTVRPVPASSGHVLDVALNFPPDTAYCRAHLNRSCYRPAQYQTAYNLKPLFDKGIDGTGQTIVIVDAFGSPTIREDLATFDKTFGLPDPPKLTIIQPAGPVPPFPTGSPLGPGDVAGWGVETTLDVEYSHVMAPGANILLVETPVSETEGVMGFPEIVAAENYVIDHNLGDVISQSFGATEETFPSRQSLLDLRGAFFNARRHHVTVLASSGDAGATNNLPDISCCYPFPVNSWPSSDPLVTSLGGTQMHLDAVTGQRTAPDNVWNDQVTRGLRGGAAGGGTSKVFERPDFQDNVERVTGDQRGTPDISMSAASDGGAVVYWTFCLDGHATVCGPQWRIVGGTSESTPLFAGIVALADQANGHHRVGDINQRLYDMGPHAAANGIVDVTSGNITFQFCQSACGTPGAVIVTVPGAVAGPGYDLASGWGTIDAATFVPALIAGGDDGQVHPGGDH